MSVTLRTRLEYLREWVRRFIAYQDTVTWFGNLGIAQAFGRATSDLAEMGETLYMDLKRRFSIRAAPEDVLPEVAAEYGTEQLGATRSRMLIIVEPDHQTVMSISLGTGPVGAGDEIEVGTPTVFAVGNSIRIRSGDGTVTETKNIVGITVGTGPGGGDELEVTALAGVYTPATDDVAVLLRVTIPVDTTVTTSAGPSFQTMATLTAGDANPVLNGESQALGLADKVWCECTAAGASGNVDAETVLDFSPAVAGVARVFNPEAATNGEDTEAAYSLRYRTAHRGTLANMETLSWLEQVAGEGNTDCIRAIQATASSASTMAAKVLKRNGGAFSASDLTALEDYIEGRVRSYMSVSLSNVTMTSVTVEARITLDPNADLRTVWRLAADAIAKYLDWRTWPWGSDVTASDLFNLVNDTEGVASVDVPSFLPAANVSVAADSLPTMVYLALEDTATGNTVGATLAVSF